MPWDLSSSPDMACIEAGTESRLWLLRSAVTVISCSALLLESSSDSAATAQLHISAIEAVQSAKLFLSFMNLSPPSTSRTLPVGFQVVVALGAWLLAVRATAPTQFAVKRSSIGAKCQMAAGNAKTAAACVEQYKSRDSSEIFLNKRV
jgi:hypothetical protein